MIYAPEDFIALSNAVEDGGGKLLLEPCEGHEVRMKVPDARGDMRWERFHTTHCGMSARMRLTYDPQRPVRLQEEAEPERIMIVEHPGEEFTGGLVTVCAVDDCVGLWPRYSKVISKRSYQK